MKNIRKIISIFILLFSAISLSSCARELNSLEWVDLPKSVYYVGEMDESKFKKSVSIKINGGDPLTLETALSLNPTNLTFTGFDLGSTGSKTITIKYKSVSIYWAYQVIQGDIPSEEVTPTYGWYGNGSASTFILNNVNDLYGFANIVNGKDGKTADSFVGKTVKLGANIDLTGKVWEPIGAAPRKDIVELKYDGEVTTAPTEGNKIYFLEGKLQYNAASAEEIKWGSGNNDPSITTPDDFVAKYNAAKTANKLDERDGLFFIDSYVFGKYEGGTATATSIGQFKFFTGIDNKVGNYFEGTFDGQGRKITGLSDVGYTPTVVYTYANSSMMVKGYTFGLFGVVKNNVTVKNLTFEDVLVVGAYYDSTDKELVLAEIDSVGAAIGYAFGDGNLTLDNIKVLSGSITAQMAAGGIIGRFYNKGNTLIQNCENRANITLTNGGYHAGGIAGYGTINPDGTKTVEFINNTNYGNIITGKVSTAGAMINYVGKGNIVENKPLFDNCRNFGNIYGSQTVNQIDQSWGLVGQSMSYHNYNNCVNYGTVTNELPQS